MKTKWLLSVTMLYLATTFQLSTSSPVDVNVKKTHDDAPSKDASVAKRVVAKDAHILKVAQKPEKVRLPIRLNDFVEKCVLTFFVLIAHFENDPDYLKLSQVIFKLDKVNLKKNCCIIGMTSSVTRLGYF